MKGPAPPSPWSPGGISHACGPGDPDAGDDSGVRELRASLQRVVDTATADVLGLIRYSIPIRTATGTTFEERYWSATHTPLLDADAAGIMLADQRGGLRVMASSTEEAHLLELYELQNNEGPCLDCYRTGRPVAREDLPAMRTSWPLPARTVMVPASGLARDETTRSSRPSASKSATAALVGPGPPNW